MDRVILHCDLNNFYASVETILHPEYKGKPIAVCGDPKKRHGIVLAKSQPAKIMGVKTGDTVWQAQQKCPDITIVPPTFREYVKYSDIVFKIYTEYTDRVEHFGMDECWLDVTGSVGLFGDGKKIADTIRKRVYDETGLTISVGVSWTKSFAKLGSDLKKPDATTVISRENYKTVVWNLPVGEMIYIGRSSVSRLKKLNINTLGELANADRTLLKQHFGIVGDKLIDAASGNEKEPVKFYYDVHIPKSVGHGTTTTKDVENLEQAKIVVYALSEMVATRLRKYNLVARCVSVGLRNTSLEWFSRQLNLIEPVNNASDIANAALKLLKENYNFTLPLRTIS
ncbi:MAG: DNA polymerase IV, partial [Eubacteriales bacterium]|nr:DNA polymerase IV [Clostridiales bacterium]MDY5720865.1 DNA polymerase IV [Eubacteriales bacterium]